MAAGPDPHGEQLLQEVCTQCTWEPGSNELKGALLTRLPPPPASQGFTETQVVKGLGGAWRFASP